MSLTKKIIVVALPLLLSCSSAENENRKSDSVLEKINVEKLDTELINFADIDESYGKEYVDFSYNFLQTSLFKRHLNTAGLLIDPSNTSFIKRFSYSYKKAGEHEKAMNVLQAAVDASQTEEELMNNFSYIAWNYLYFYRDYHKTIKTVGKMLELSNNDLGISCHGEACLLLKGQALYRLGKINEAVELFSEYQNNEIELGFNKMGDPLVVFYKARCLSEQENYDDAISYFKYFTKDQPSAEAYFQLAKIYLITGELLQAENYIRLSEDALSNGYTFREPYFERFDKVFAHQIQDLKVEIENIKNSTPTSIGS